MWSVYLVLSAGLIPTHASHFFRVSLLYLKENNFFLQFKKESVCIFWSPVQPPSFNPQTGGAPGAPGGPHRALQSLHFCPFNTCWY